MVHEAGGFALLVIPRRSVEQAAEAERLGAAPRGGAIVAAVEFGPPPWAWQLLVQRQQVCIELHSLVGVGRLRNLRTDARNLFVHVSHWSCLLRRGRGRL